MKKRYIILLVIVLALAAAYSYIWRSVHTHGNRFIGSKSIPCIDGVKVKFYQGTESFEPTQSLIYRFASPSGKESEWQFAAGTDDFDGVDLSDFQITCTDTNVTITYLGELPHTFTHDSVAQMLK